MSDTCAKKSHECETLCKNFLFYILNKLPPIIFQVKFVWKMFLLKQTRKKMYKNFAFSLLDLLEKFKFLLFAKINYKERFSVQKV